MLKRGRNVRIVEILDTTVMETSWQSSGKTTSLYQSCQHSTVPQPVKYNASMRGVDRSDQLINKYKSLRKTNEWWKTVFFHLIDICRMNSYILFMEFRKQVILTLFVAMTAFIVCITYPPLRSSDKKNKNILPIFSFFLIFTAPEFKI